MVICPQNKQNGFSLIEAMVTLAIAAIVLSIGVPSFQLYIQNNHQTTAISEMATALQLARNTAITRRTPVTLCKSPNGTNCVIGGGSGDWSQGWMMFTNPNGIDGTAGLTAAEELLRVHEALQGNNTFIGSGPIVNQVTFMPRGLINNGFGGTITHCDSRGNTAANALVISIGGQVRQAEDTDGDGVVENGTGGPVTCPTS
jgi:type IV fimbrial biogenesis protein FimT